MEYRLDQAVEILERTPRVVEAMLGGLGEEWTHAGYGPETFSPFDVVGHLIHGDLADWVPRARHILEHGDSVPFEPFDRYAMYERDRGKTMGQLLEEFRRVRGESLESLRGLNLSESDLDRPGMHPALGAVTMRQLLATWVVHDLHHIAQIAKCMARQYKGEVGAWEEYLGILGRSS